MQFDNKHNPTRNVMADIILERDDWIPKDTDKAQMFTTTTLKIILEVPAIAQAREIGKKKKTTSI